MERVDGAKNAGGPLHMFQGIGGCPLLGGEATCDMSRQLSLSTITAQRPREAL